MAETWESKGLYTYRSYTKIDTWAISSQEGINIHAIHEFVHSYITRSSNYGAYLMALMAILKNQSNYSRRFEGEEKNEFNMKINRLEKVFLALNDSMKNMQETIATTVETLYVCYLNGCNAARSYILNLGSYQKYVSRFNYIFDSKFLLDLKNSYQLYLKKYAPAILSEFEKCEEDNKEIFYAIMFFLEIGTAALNIEPFDCTEEKWSYPNAFVNTELVCKKYNPDKRFEDIISRVLNRDMINCEILKDYTIKKNIDGIKNDILSKLVYSSGKAINEVKKTDKNIINEMFEIKLSIICSMNNFEKSAFYRAIPSVLSKNSINIFSKYEIAKTTYFPNKQDEIVKLFLEQTDVIMINVPPGFESKNKCAYQIEIDVDTMSEKKKSLIMGKDFCKEKRINFNMSEKDLFSLIDKIGDDKTLILIGNYHLYAIIEKLKTKRTKIYIFLSNCFDITYGFVKDIVGSNTEDSVNACFFDNEDVKNILVIRKDNMLIFQPQINRVLENGNEDFLKFGTNVVSGKDRTLISRFLRWNYGYEANFVERVKDDFF